MMQIKNADGKVSEGKEEMSPRETESIYIIKTMRKGGGGGTTEGGF